MVSKINQSKSPDNATMQYCHITYKSKMARQKLEEVTGGKAYNGRSNLKLVQDLGGTASFHSKKIL